MRRRIKMRRSSTNNSHSTSRSTTLVFLALANVTHGTPRGQGSTVKYIFIYVSTNACMYACMCLNKTCTHIYIYIDVYKQGGGGFRMPAERSAERLHGQLPVWT